MLLLAVNSVSVHFEMDSVAVTEGHRTVVCVVLDGVPTGGMSEDLPLTLLLANTTAGIYDMQSVDILPYIMYANRNWY